MSDNCEHLTYQIHLFIKSISYGIVIPNRNNKFQIFLKTQLYYQFISDDVYTHDLNRLTHSCLEILTTVVCSCETFENNFGINQKLEKYFKGSY